MRASMHADGTTFHPRHNSDPAGTEDLDSRERTGGGPHKGEVGAETTTVSATRLAMRITSAAWVDRSF